VQIRKNAKTKLNDEPVICKNCSCVYVCVEIEPYEEIVDRAEEFSTPSGSRSASPVSVDTTQKCSDHLPSYPPVNHHCSDVVNERTADSCCLDMWLGNRVLYTTRRGTITGPPSSILRGEA